jgi:signal transduction histidine kinase
VSQIPTLRVFAFASISLLVFLHNRYLLGIFSWKDYTTLLTVVFSYIVLSWIAIYYLFDIIDRVHLGILFLVTDIFIFILFIYHSGGEKSLFFFLLMARVADQANTSYKRVIVLSHLSTLAYLLLICYLFFVEKRDISWTGEAVKISIIYFTNMYLSLTARTSERIKNTTRASINLSRQLISQLDEQAKALEQEKIKAESASKAKSDFLANMSHEFRTPLNHIIGFTELVADKHFGDLNKMQEEYLGDALNSSRHLLSLINEVLDLSKIEAGKMSLETSEIELRNMVETSAFMVKERAVKNGIRVNIDLQGMPEVIRGDKRKLKQVMYNLLGNAVKFTPTGGEIRVVGCRLKPENGDLKRGNGSVLRLPDDGHLRGNAPGDYVEVSIEDSGIGIKRQDLERIFMPFEQAEGSAGRKYQGTGLGLSLSRQIIELHGGKIWAESRGEGKGSSFHFVIPMGTPVS